MLQVLEGGARSGPHLHALGNVFPAEALVIGALAAPRDLGADHEVGALPAQLLQSVRMSHQQHRTTLLTWFLWLLTGRTLTARPITSSAMPSAYSYMQREGSHF